MNKQKSLIDFYKQYISKTLSYDKFFFGKNSKTPLLFLI